MKLEDGAWPWLAGSWTSGATSTRTTSSRGRSTRTGSRKPARAAMAEALRLGTRDARLFYHAGMIERALGNVGEAARYLRLALDTNPHFHALQADEARRVLRAPYGPSATARRGVAP